MLALSLLVKLVSTFSLYHLDDGQHYVTSDAKSNERSTVQSSLSRWGKWTTPFYILAVFLRRSSMLEIRLASLGKVTTVCFVLKTVTSIRNMKGGIRINSFRLTD